MHSPWGLYYSIIEKTGWTLQYLLWKESWVNVQMMLADAPRFKSKTNGNGENEEIKEESSLDELRAALEE